LKSISQTFDFVLNVIASFLVASKTIGQAYRFEATKLTTGEVNNTYQPDFSAPAEPLEQFAPKGYEVCAFTGPFTQIKIYPSKSYREQTVAYPPSERVGG
jgi:hypothetical protein